MVKYLANALIGGDGQIEKRNMSWNMIGSFLYALASMVLTIAVIQIVGEDEGGIFSFAYSTFGQHMFMVAYFGIRPFQITDTRRRFTFGEYLRLRLMTCGAALVAGLFYVTVINRDYAFVKAATVFFFSAAKYAIEGNMADKYQAVFGAIFMPTSVINLVAGFVIRPYITKLSDQWERNALPEFAGTVGRLAAIIAALTALAVGGAWILGIPVLSMLYPKIAYMLRECRLALAFIILGGAFNAYVNLFYYALIIMQEQKRIFLGYVGVTAAALLISSPCVLMGPNLPGR